MDVDLMWLSYLFYGLKFTFQITRVWGSYVKAQSYQVDIRKFDSVKEAGCHYIGPYVISDS